MRSAFALKALAVLLVAMALPPLLSLFGPLHYIAELGGFPMLGSGQGVIKYLAILVLAISLVRLKTASRAELFWLNYTPVALVLLWIGGMKFFAFEAEGIVDLVSTSPLLSWLYLLFDQQTASNFIGFYDLTALALLGAGYFWPRLFIPWLFAGVRSIRHDPNLFNHLCWFLDCTWRVNWQRCIYYQRLMVYR